MPTMATLQCVRTTHCRICWQLWRLGDRNTLALSPSLPIRPRNPRDRAVRVERIPVTNLGPIRTAAHIDIDVSFAGAQVRKPLPYLSKRREGVAISFQCSAAATTNNPVSNVLIGFETQNEVRFSSASPRSCNRKTFCAALASRSVFGAGGIALALPDRKADVSIATRGRRIGLSPGVRASPNAPGLSRRR